MKVHLDTTLSCLVNTIWHPAQITQSLEKPSELNTRDQLQTNHGDTWPTELFLALSAASNDIVCP